MQKTTKTGKIFKVISILIYGNIVINELSLKQRAVSKFRDKSDPTRVTGRQTSIPGVSLPFRDGWQPCTRPTPQHIQPAPAPHPHTKQCVFPHPPRKCETLVNSTGCEKYASSA